MIIRTITCHDVYNYGASLQAYALQHYLESLGHDCRIIDYKPPYLTHKYAYTYLPKDHPNYSLYKKLGPLGFLFALYCSRKEWHHLNRKKAFDTFTKEYLKLTTTRVTEPKDFDTLSQADVYITGSDQVWNTDMQNGRDSSFYLGFAPQGKRLISYAASFGLPQIPVVHHAFIKDNLSRFDWISVRETTGVKILRDMNIQAEQVLDPVFLLDKAEWLSYCKRKHSEKYLLLYYLGKRSTEFETMVKKIASHRNLKIYSLNDALSVPFADKNINGAGPIEFLEYISQADFVLGTSFHATAFSLIFERQFGVCPIKGQNNQARMRDVLSLFHLDNHFLEYGKELPQDIDYSQITPLVKKSSEESRNLLLQHL